MANYHNLQVHTYPLATQAAGEAIIRDITERKRLEDALQSILRGTSATFGESYFRTLVEELSLAFRARYALVGKFQASQSARLQTLAYWADGKIREDVILDICGAPFLSTEVNEVYTHLPNSHSLFPRDEVLSGLEIQGGFTIQLRDIAGKPIGLLAVFHDKPMEASRLARDILTIFAARAGAELVRLQTEKARKESERRIRELLENLNLQTLMLDREGNILFCNDCLLKLLGASKGEVMGRNWFIDFVPEPHRSRISADFFSSLAAGEIPSATEGPIVTRSGETRMIRWYSTLIRGTDGEVAGAASIGRDLTPELELEKQLRNAQKYEALGTLSGGIAHDFNNILGALVGYAELSRRVLDKSNPAYVYQNGILKAAMRAKELVQQIMTVARQQEDTAMPVKVCLIVKEVVHFVSKVIPSSITIKQQIHPQAGMVMADPVQIHQVLMNLCTNASHAMRDQACGVLKILLEFRDLETGEADAVGLAAGRYVHLEVSDTGHGMSPETMDRIFDPYFTTKQFGEGTGLGLAVVRGIVTKHGGGIRVTSRVGKGTRFSIYWPRYTGPKVKADAEVELSLRGDERILLVDDEKPLVEAGKSMLESLGYRVTALDNSLEALRMFIADPNGHDLLLTDHAMPGITGIGLSEKVLAVRPDMPIILCTGYTHESNLEKARRLGISEILLKPVSTSILGSALRRALGCGKLDRMEEKQILENGLRQNRWQT